MFKSLKICLDIFELLSDFSMMPFRSVPSRHEGG